MSINKFGQTTKTPLKYKMRCISTEQKFPLTANGDYDMRNHRLCNLKEANEERDAVTKKYVDDSLKYVNSVILSNSAKLDLRFAAIENSVVKALEKKILKDIDVSFLTMQEQLQKYIKEELNQSKI